MKKLLLLIVLLYFIQPIAAQMGRFHKYAVSETNIPKSVLDSQHKNFPQGFVTNWYRYSNLPETDLNSSYYISTFQKQGIQSFKAYYTQDGELISKITFMPTYTLPDQIIDQIHNSHLNTRIKSGDLIELYDKNIQIYRIRLNTEGLLQNVYFDKYARMLDGRKVPIEVISLN